MDAASRRADQQDSDLIPTAHEFDEFAIDALSGGLLLDLPDVVLVATVIRCSKS